MNTSPRRTITMTAVMVVITWTAACGRTSRVEQNAAAGQTSATDTSFAAMNVRGKAVMGVDQDSSTHRFEDTRDGGRIVFTSDTDVDTDVEAIRSHLRQIAGAFAKGDFTDPMMIHMGRVPGTDVMQERKSEIRYASSDIPKGGVVTITTKDAAALKAIHAFLEFQRTAHHTHDM